ncbi:hypothetical protein Avbf_14286 [Armadillidium vulgare]|nr:hypothetical protein Avbf_14286 [Armadillidium vulgare]
MAVGDRKCIYIYVKLKLIFLIGDRKKYCLIFNHLSIAYEKNLANVNQLQNMRSEVSTFTI